MLGAYAVGHAADGSPLKPPSQLLHAVEAGNTPK
jgi:hypothetical protein